MEEQTYTVEGEFAFHSYQPAHLKVGMHFLTKVTVGTLEPEWLFFTLEHVPEDEEMFMSLYGAPVHLLIISTDGEEEEYASPNQIGWFNDDNYATDVRPITDKEINIILNEHDGFMDIESDETGDIILYEGKAIISYLTEDGDEDSET